jgi:hypothetical protein
MDDSYRVSLLKQNEEAMQQLKIDSASILDFENLDALKFGQNGCKSILEVQEKHEKHSSKG